MIILNAICSVLFKHIIPIQCRDFCLGIFQFKQNKSPDHLEVELSLAAALIKEQTLNASAVLNALEAPKFL